MFSILNFLILKFLIRKGFLMTPWPFPLLLLIPPLLQNPLLLPKRQDLLPNCLLLLLPLPMIKKKAGKIWIGTLKNSMDWKKQSGKNPPYQTRKKIFKFIEGSNSEDDKFLANLWLQKFDAFEENKLAKSPTARPKSTRVPPMKPTTNPTTVAEPSRKTPSIPKVVKEVSSTGHSDTPAALTSAMIQQWSVSFIEAVSQNYAYDPKQGEQNR